jgi:hypothetical protein
MKRMKRIKNLNMRRVCTQGIVRDDGITRMFTASFRLAVSHPITSNGFTRVIPSFSR